MNNDFKKGEVLRYTGKGFIGFRKSDREVEFVRYVGVLSAFVKYDGYNVLVYKSELEKINTL